MCLSLKKEKCYGKCCIKMEEFRTEFNCYFSKRSEIIGGSFSPNTYTKILLAVYKNLSKKLKKTEGEFHT